MLVVVFHPPTNVNSQWIFGGQGPSFIRCVGEAEASVIMLCFNMRLDFGGAKSLMSSHSVEPFILVERQSGNYWLYRCDSTVKDYLSIPKRSERLTS